MMYFETYDQYRAFIERHTEVEIKTCKCGETEGLQLYSPTNELTCRECIYNDSVEVAKEEGIEKAIELRQQYLK